MQYKLMRSTRSNLRRRGRLPVPASEQYSLFAAASRTASEDALHFQRQAQLCQRLLSGLHQPDLVELLGRLHEEFEARAAHRGAADGVGAARGADDEMGREMAEDAPVG